MYDRPRARRYEALHSGDELVRELTRRPRAPSPVPRPPKMPRQLDEVVSAARELDHVELASRGDHLIELPWHFRGTGDGGRGTWTSGELADEFVSRVERFVPASSGSVVHELPEGLRVLDVFLLVDDHLLDQEGPGLPGSGTRTTFYLARARGRSA